jgi:hypothetical protein
VGDKALSRLLDSLEYITSAWASAALTGLTFAVLLAALVWICTAASDRGRFLPKLSPEKTCWLWWLICFKVVISFLWWLPSVVLPVLPDAGSLMQSRSVNNSGALHGVGMNADGRDLSAASESPEADLRGEDTWQNVIAGDRRLSTIRVGLFSLWLFGILVAIGLAVLEATRQRQVVRSASALDDTSLCEMTRRLAAEMGLSAPPRLVCSPGVAAPFVTGTVATGRGASCLADSGSSARRNPYDTCA